MPREGLPWGKLDKGTGLTHRLEHHCADVAACFAALLDEPVLRERFDRAAGKRLDEVSLARLTVLAFLHDFGKVNVGFQFKGVAGAPRFVNHIEASAYACNRSSVANAVGLHPLLAWGEAAVPHLLCATLAHHGRPLSRDSMTKRGPENIWSPFRGYDPIRACRNLLGHAQRWFPEAFSDGPQLSSSPALQHLFAGTVAIADQVGSNEELFPYAAELCDTYNREARKRAKRAIRRFGFERSRWAKKTRAREFADLFGDGDWTPRPLQTAVADAPLDCPLLILESDTGSGKTEAAVWRFAKLWKEGRVDGLYFALPTRAAAVQLQLRVHRAVARMFPSGSPFQALLAVPGYFRAGDATGRRIGAWDVEWIDNPDDRERLARWSAESARKFLTATVAVGTVDQALLAGLQAKWAHFRGAALARSLLVVDEVHASDAYVTQVLRGLLRDHLRVGGHALLMSATLGSASRHRLTAPAARLDSPQLSEAKAVDYPVLSLSDLCEPPRHLRFDSVRYVRAIQMCSEPVLRDPTRIAECAIRAARRGAKVLVVRNTVKTARAVFEEVRALGEEHLLLQVADGPAVHHSRFAAEDRKRLDEAVEAALGKGRGGEGRIVIGTQTLEQSLDIDADLLLTDLCPVDVLLQRIGRLHRHRDTKRPPGFGEPRCTVLVPQSPLGPGGLLKHGLGMGKNGGVYRDLRMLERTRRLVAEHTIWRLPNMNRMLVEEGTHKERLDLEAEMGPEWSHPAEEVDGRARAERIVARRHVVNRQRSFGAISFPPREEQVRTRLGDDGVRIRLRGSVVGPFGSRVTTWNMPTHLFRPGAHPTSEEIDDARAERDEGGLLLKIGGRRFRYDRAGIRRT